MIQTYGVQLGTVRGVRTVSEGRAVYLSERCIQDPETRRLGYPKSLVILTNVSGNEKRIDMTLHLHTWDWHHWFGSYNMDMA